MRIGGADEYPEASPVTLDNRDGRQKKKCLIHGSIHKSSSSGNVRCVPQERKCEVKDSIDNSEYAAMRQIPKKKHKNIDNIVADTTNCR